MALLAEGFFCKENTCQKTLWQVFYIDDLFCICREDYFL